MAVTSLKNLVERIKNVKVRLPKYTTQTRRQCIIVLHRLVPEYLGWQLKSCSAALDSVMEMYPVCCYSLVQEINI